MVLIWYSQQFCEFVSKNLHSKLNIHMRSPKSIIIIMSVSHFVLVKTTKSVLYRPENDPGTENDTYD